MNQLTRSARKHFRTAAFGGGGAGVPLLGWSDSGNSFDPATEEANPQNSSFSDDGTKLFMAGASGDDLNEYSTTDFSLTAPVWVSANSWPNTNILSGTWTPDGLTFVHSGVSGLVYQTAFSTAFDASTMGASASINPSNVGALPATTYLNTGAKMIILDITAQALFQFTVTSAPYDITGGLVYETITVDLSAFIASDAARAIWLSADEKYLSVVDNTEDEVLVFELTTAGTLADGVTLNHTVDLLGVVTNPTGIYYREDVKKAYITSIGNGVVELDYTGV